jgi:hypothetical protein
MTQQHIYDTFVVGAGISGIAAAIRLKKWATTTLKSLKKPLAWVVHGAKTPTLVVVVTCHRRSTRIHLHRVPNGAICLRVSLRS